MKSQRVRRVYSYLLIAFCILIVTGTSRLMAQDDSALFWSISKDGEQAGSSLWIVPSKNPACLPSLLIDQNSAESSCATSWLDPVRTITQKAIKKYRSTFLRYGFLLFIFMAIHGAIPYAPMLVEWGLLCRALPIDSGDFFP